MTCAILILGSQFLNQRRQQPARSHHGADNYNREFIRRLLPVCLVTEPSSSALARNLPEQIQLGRWRLFHHSMSD